MEVLAEWPTLAHSCVEVYERMSLMSVCLLLQQCPAYLVTLTWIVCEIGENMISSKLWLCHYYSMDAASGLDTNKMQREKARWEIHKNATCCLEQILEKKKKKKKKKTPYKTASVGLPTFSLSLSLSRQCNRN